MRTCAIAQLIAPSTGATWVHVTFIPSTWCARARNRTLTYANCMLFKSGGTPRKRNRMKRKRHRFPALYCRCTPTTTSSTCTCTVLYCTDNRVIPLQSIRQWSPASLPKRVWLARKVASVSSRCLRLPIAGHNRIVPVSQVRCERDSEQRLSSQCCPDHIRTVGQSGMHTFITHKYDYIQYVPE